MDLCIIMDINKARSVKVYSDIANGLDKNGMTDVEMYVTDPESFNEWKEKVKNGMENAILSEGDLIYEK
jgi:hypothetical protein